MELYCIYGTYLLHICSMVIVLLSSAHHATTIDQPHGEMSSPGQSILCPELRQLRTIEKKTLIHFFSQLFLL
jgi:hypothetical protein